MEVGDQREDRSEVGCRRKQRKHPDNKEVERDHGIDFGEADGLDADAGYDLLVGESKQEFAWDLPRLVRWGEFAENY